MVQKRIWSLQPTNDLGHANWCCYTLAAFQWKIRGTPFSPVQSVQKPLCHNPCGYVLETWMSNQGMKERTEAQTQMRRGWAQLAHTLWGRYRISSLQVQSICFIQLTKEVGLLKQEGRCSVYCWPRRWFYCLQLNEEAMLANLFRALCSGAISGYKHLGGRNCGRYWLYTLSASAHGPWKGIAIPHEALGLLTWRCSY